MLDDTFYRKALKESLIAIDLSTQKRDTDRIYLWTHYIAAASSLHLGDIRQAESICEKALAIYPSHLDSYYLLAKLHDQEGNMDEAQECSARYHAIREEIQCYPERFGTVVNNTFWADWLVHIIQGKAVYEKGNIREGSRIFKDVIDKNRNRSETSRLIGEFYFTKGGYKEALACFRMFRDLEEPIEKSILYMEAECYGQLNDTKNQMEVLGEIVALFPEEIDRFEDIARIQFERSNYVLARYCLEELLARGRRTEDTAHMHRICAEWVAHQETFALQSPEIPTYCLTGVQAQKISACLMVKNEEACLRRCLSSLHEIVQEIIVVDTGSTDSTVEIAKQFGSHIYHRPWEEDFSKHRNQSMSYARGDWILIIDADEALDPKTAGHMHRIAGETTKHAIVFKVLNCSSDGQMLSLIHSPRLFRNHVGCHYQGIVHNQVRFPGEACPSHIRLFHYGYYLDDQTMEKKRRRTIRLLEKQIHQNPHDPFPRFNLACSFFGKGDFGRAAVEGERAIALIRRPSNPDTGYMSLYYIASAAHFNMGRMEKAESIAMEGIKQFPDNLDVFFVLTMLHDQKGDHLKVIEYGRRYLELHEMLMQSKAVKSADYKTLGERWSALLAVSLACHQLHDRSKAWAYFTDACSCAPTDRFPEKERAKFCVKIGQYEAAADHLRAATGLH
jgi:tetratricopeptide (TPR) repeat protein